MVVINWGLAHLIIYFGISQYSFNANFSYQKNRIEYESLDHNNIVIEEMFLLGTWT